MAPPGDPQRQGTGRPVQLIWSAPASPVDGHFVYRGATLEAAIQTGLLNTTAVTGTRYVDTTSSGLLAGEYVYAVRAVKEIRTGAGSFQGLSRAGAVTITLQ